MAFRHGSCFEENGINIIHRSCQDGVNDIICNAFIQKDGFDSLTEEIFHLGEDGLLLVIFARKEFESLFNAPSDIPVNLSVCNDIDSADGLAAESKGILGARRNESAEEGSGQVIQFICQGESPADGFLRQDIARKARHVLFENGLGHILLLSIEKGIFLAHFALEFGEFGHHAGSKVGFGKVSGPVGISHFFSREIPVFPDGSGQFLQTVCLVQHGSHAFLIVDAGEAFSVTYQRFLAVVFKEEFRIIETGAEYSFIADLHVMNGFGAAIPDGEEIRHEAAIFVSYRVVTLMIPHRSNDCRYRELQEFIIDTAIQRSGVFDEVIDFFQKIFIVPYMAAQFFGNL